MNIIDISRDALKTEIYPGDPLPHAEFVSRIGEDSDCNLSTLFSCVHTGTHADAPLHFIDGGASIDEVPLEPFIGPCTVIEAPEGAITGEDVNSYFPQKCERLLIKGGGACRYRAEAHRHGLPFRRHKRRSDSPAQGIFGGGDMRARGARPERGLPRQLLPLRRAREARRA